MTLCTNLINPQKEIKHFFNKKYNLFFINILNGNELPQKNFSKRMQLFPYYIVFKNGMNTKNMNNRSNQLNPNNWRFWASRGLPLPENFHEAARLYRTEWGTYPKHARDNRASQLNPNNKGFWRSRGLSGGL